MKRIKKENKDKILEMKREAISSEYETEWDDKGVPKSKKKSKISMGRKSRAAGSRFELKVRKDLESKERIVDKWTNNVDLEENKIVPVKRRFLRKPFGPTFYMGISTIGTGFPDFITIKQAERDLHSVIGVEVKMSGVLSKIEKEKCAWYLKEGIFSSIWIAKKGEKKGTIDYIDFKEKYGSKFSQFFEN